MKILKGVEVTYVFENTSACKKTVKLDFTQSYPVSVDEKELKFMIRGEYSDLLNYIGKHLVQQIKNRTKSKKRIFYDFFVTHLKTEVQ